MTLKKVYMCRVCFVRNALLNVTKRRSKSWRGGGGITAFCEERLRVVQCLLGTHTACLLVLLNFLLIDFFAVQIAALEAFQGAALPDTAFWPLTREDVKARTLELGGTVRDLAAEAELERANAERRKNDRLRHDLAWQGMLAGKNVRFNNTHYTDAKVSTLPTSPNLPTSLPTSLPQPLSPSR